MFKDNEYETDVLVIGGGAAGLRAALEAGRKGVKVLVASKGRAGKSGCSVMCTAAYSAAFQEVGDDPDSHFADSLKVGEELNDRQLLRLLVNDAPERLRELRRLGVRLMEKDSQLVPYRKSLGHSVPRGYGVLSSAKLGMEITSCLLNAAEAAGVGFLDGVYVSDLMLSEGEVAGCIGVALNRGELVVIKAKATVLATGGGSGIYPRTDNPRGTIGDGHAMAWRVGAELVNMEFVMFHPAIPVRPAAGPYMIPAFLDLLSDGAVLRNRLGEDILKKYGYPSFREMNRDLASRCEALEIRAGLGVDGGLYLDATGMDSLLLEAKHSYARQHLLSKGVDLSKEPVVVAPGAHAFVGGLRINNFCETNLPGLYACGEAAGGIHGAHELPGNHLPDTQVFGAIAGKQAAARAQGKAKVTCGEALIRANIKEIEGMVGPTSYDELTKITSELRETIGEHASNIRNESSLKQARERIEHFRSEMPGLKVQPKDLPKLLSLRSTLEACALIVEGALAREESRGGHFREDFPERDDSRFLSHIVLSRKKEGTMQKVISPL